MRKILAAWKIFFALRNYKFNPKNGSFFNSMRREYSIQSAYANKSAMVSKQPWAGQTHTFMNQVQQKDNSRRQLRIALVVWGKLPITVPTLWRLLLLRGYQGHDMESSHPGTIWGSVFDTSRHVPAVPEAQKGPKVAPKLRFFTFWPFRARNGLVGWGIDMASGSPTGSLIFCFTSRDSVTLADMGPPDRGPPEATSGGPLFPFHMTLQYSNWVGPILSSGFHVAAKLMFSDWPKEMLKRPFRNRNVRLRSHRNCGRFGTNLSVVALFVSELRSFSQWPPARKSPFSPI